MKKKLEIIQYLEKGQQIIAALVFKAGKLQGTKICSISLDKSQEQKRVKKGPDRVAQLVRALSLYT